MDKNKIEAMTIGGQKLGVIKKKLAAFAQVEFDLATIDQYAETLIKQAGAISSFKTVPGYHWSTCINTNAGIVHGIPKGKIKQGDLVTIDVGLKYHGYHVDTATSFFIGTPSLQDQKFLDAGRQTLKKAISQAKAGKLIVDISRAIQTNIEAKGFNVVRDLTGHGVGKELHQSPAIPCYVDGSAQGRTTISPGMTLAIEVIYTAGDWHLVLAEDGWTLSTKDNLLSAVFEDTVLIEAKNTTILTA